MAEEAASRTSMLRGVVRVLFGAVMLVRGLMEPMALLMLLRGVGELPSEGVDMLLPMVVES